MRKVVPVENTETQYFCDVCNEEIRIDRSRDDQIEDHMRKCALCLRDTCFTCRRKFSLHISVLNRSRPRQDICNDCYEPRIEIVDRITKNCSIALQIEFDLFKEFFTWEQQTPFPE